MSAAGNTLQSTSHGLLLSCLQGAARNCLLVKGGSSFNALVRALKQDLIDSGTAAKDPALLYQIDKVRLGPLG